MIKLNFRAVRPEDFQYLHYGVSEQHRPEDDLIVFGLDLGEQQGNLRQFHKPFHKGVNRLDILLLFGRLDNFFQDQRESMNSLQGSSAAHGLYAG